MRLERLGQLEKDPPHRDCIYIRELKKSAKAHKGCRAIEEEEEEEEEPLHFI
jgi:hypothetical protein